MSEQSHDIQTRSLEPEDLSMEKAVEQLSNEIQEALLKLLADTTPKVPHSDEVPEWFSTGAQRAFIDKLSEQEVIDGIQRVLAPHFPGDFKVIAMPTTGEDRRQRIARMGLSMNRKTWNEVMVPLGYEPVPEQEFTITITMEE